MRSTTSTTTKAELKQHQYGGVFGGPIWKNKLFFFTDFQQTRRVAGASTGVVQVMSDDERNGIFPDSALTGAVQGDAWAATLMSRGGGTIVLPASPPYNQLGTPVTTTRSATATGQRARPRYLRLYRPRDGVDHLPMIPHGKSARRLQLF